MILYLYKNQEVFDLEEVKQRMRLTKMQQNAVIHLDDNGVADPASLFVMDFDTWQQLQPYDFFDYFAEEGTVASYARFKPAWQRYCLLHPIEAKVLQGIYDGVNSDARVILRTPKLSRRFYGAYVVISTLVDELDALVDRDIRDGHRWNHGYVLNDNITV